VLDSISTDTRGLIASALQYKLDFFVCGFVEPRIDSAASTATVGSVNAVSPASENSSEDDEDAKEGIPKRYQDTHLKHPELGEVGSKFYKASLSKPCKMLVVHHDGHSTDGKRRPSGTTAVFASGITSADAVVEDKAALSEV